MTDQNIESPTNIAAGVRRTGSHQAAELHFAQLDRQRAEIVERTRAVIAETYGRGDDTGAREIRALEKERVEIENRLRPLASELRDHRVERATRVTRVLEPTKHRAAEAALIAIDELRKAVSVFDQCTDEVTKAGANDGWTARALSGLLSVSLQEVEQKARVAIGGTP